LEEVLRRNSIGNLKDYSFYRKTAKLETIVFKDVNRKRVIIGALKHINNLKNHLLPMNLISIFRKNLLFGP